MSVLVHLERFEGPLALLLHLIRKQEMDIFDINIHQITSQYLEYVRTMKQLDLEYAGEFVALAATLIQIKSRMLLPQYNEDGEEIEDQDPRRELVHKLLEYQKFQDAGRQLYERPLLNRDVWARGEKEDLSPTLHEEIVIEDNALFGLISAYRHLLRSAKTTVHNVSVAWPSVSSRILQLRDQLTLGARLGFSRLVAALPEGDREFRSNHILVTFLSLLELAKMGFVSLFQTDSTTELYIETKRAIEREVVVRVESYDGTPTSTDLLLGESEAPPVETTVADPLEGAPTSVAFIPDAVEEEIATDEDILAEERRLNEEIVQ